MTVTTPQAAAPGAPFAVMLRGALLPATVAGLLSVVVALVVGGGSSALSAVLGLVVSVAFFGSGMMLMSKLVRSASPGAFLAVAMTVYLGQVLFILLFLMVFMSQDWVDGKALGLTALVVTLAWQAAAMVALRRGRQPIYDEPVAVVTAPDAEKEAR